VFLKTKQAVIAVDLSALEDLLKPKRARWAAADDSFIPTVSLTATHVGAEQQGRGTSMDSDTAQAEAIRSQIDELEKQIALIEQTAKEHAEGSQSADQLKGSVESLKALVAELGKAPKGQSDNQAFYFKLASLEEVLSKVEGCGSASEVDISSFHSTASDLFSQVSGKTIQAAIDEDVLEDLELFMDNTASLHAKFNSIIANLKRKMESGKYDPNMSPKLWLYWVESGVKAYAKEFNANPRTMFPMELKKTLAERLAKRYDPAVQSGEYGELKVKKASESEVTGPAEDVAKQLKVENPYSGEDQSKNDTYYKLAASDVPFINEAFADSVMSKVENAFRTI
jgi:hypothetical protein